MDKATTQNQLAISIDLDWVPEAIIADTLELLEMNSIKATIFATHPSNEINHCNKALFEVGIHPNFNFLLDGDTTKASNSKEVLKKILDIYPDAKGVRSHSLVQSSRLLQEFADNGLLYESNQFLPYAKELIPMRLMINLIRIPYNWEDDGHFGYGYSFDEFKLDFNKFNIFNFHPIHIYLNTENQARYNAAKKHYHDPKALLNFRNTGSEPGTRDLFKKLLTMINEKKYLTVTLLDIANTVE